VEKSAGWQCTIRLEDGVGASMVPGDLDRERRVKPRARQAACVAGEKNKAEGGSAKASERASMVSRVVACGCVRLRACCHVVKGGSV
jgi:hypothetical protein